MKNLRCIIIENALKFNDIIRYFTSECNYNCTISDISITKSNYMYTINAWPFPNWMDISKIYIVIIKEMKHKRITPLPKILSPVVKFL